MSLLTSLQCPHCGYSARIDKVISPGSAVRCGRCKSAFPVGGTNGNRMKSVPAVGDLDAERLQELFAADNLPRSAVKSGDLDIRVLNESGERLPPRAGGPVPAAQKKTVLDGKPLPFHGPRTMLAAILLSLLMLAGYGFSRWYVDTVISLDATATKAGAKRRATVKALADPLAKEPGQAKTKVNAPMGMGMGMGMPRGVPDNRTLAPATAQIGELVVGVFSARLGTIDGKADEECLILTLRITNLSPKAITYFSWSGPTRKVKLMDQYQNYYNRMDSITQPDQIIEPDHTSTDTLCFERPPHGAVLNLDLTLGNQKFEFTLPANFVQRGVVARPAPKVVPQAPAPALVEQPFVAERDPQLIADVRAAYNDHMKVVEVRARGKTGNNAMILRKSEREKIIKAIATKMDMTVEQIKRMIGKD